MDSSTPGPQRISPIPPRRQPPSTRTLGQWLQQYRHDHRLLPVVIANRLAIALTTLCAWEADVDLPDAEGVTRLAILFQARPLQVLQAITASARGLLTALFADIPGRLEALPPCLRSALARQLRVPEAALEPALQRVRETPRQILVREAALADLELEGEGRVIPLGPRP